MNAWQLDAKSGVPLYLQLKQKIIQQIIQGNWPPGHQIPTVRQMAVDVSINVNTVARVYGELEREGYIRTHQGKGTFVQQLNAWLDHASGREGLVLGFAQQVVEMAKAQGITLRELVEALLRLDADHAKFQTEE